jgi:hypothetical protein
MDLCRHSSPKDEIARIDLWTLRFVFHDDALSLQLYGRSSFDLKGTAE